MDLPSPVRHDVNAAFYGYEVPVSVILEGGVERPAAAAVLYEALDDVVKAAARADMDRQQRRLEAKWPRELRPW